MKESIKNTVTVTYYSASKKSFVDVISNDLYVDWEKNSELMLTKTANPKTFDVGDIIEYSIEIKNTSSQYLTGVRLVDDLGGGYLAFVTESAELCIDGLKYKVSPIETNPLTFALQELPSGQSMVLTYKSQVVFNLPESVSVIKNQVSGTGYIASGTIDGYSFSEISRGTTESVEVIKSSDMDVVNTNQPFVYYFTINNNGSQTIELSKVTDQLSTGYKLLVLRVEDSSGGSIDLPSSDYTLSPDNLLTIKSINGDSMVIGPNKTLVFSLTGFFK